MPHQPVYDKDRQFVNFTLDTTLTVGTKYILSLGYTGPLENDLAGLYYSTYDVTDPTTNITTKRLASFISMFVYSWIFYRFKQN